MPGNALIRNPAIFAIIPSQPILHHKRLARIECLRVNLETFLQIVWMYAFSPAISHFLFQATARKLQPRFVKECAEFVHARHPDANRRRIRSRSELIKNGETDREQTEKKKTCLQQTCAASCSHRKNPLRRPRYD